MEKEFNLSEKLQVFEGWHSKENRFVHISNIKEFIRLRKEGKVELREEFADAMIRYDKGYDIKEDLRKILLKMDRMLVRDEKLAGGKLT